MAVVFPPCTAFDLYSFSLWPPLSLDAENSTTPLGDFWETNEIWTYTVGLNILTEDSKVIYAVDAGIPIMLEEKGIPADQLD